MIEKILKEQFDVLLDAPESVHKLREMILQLAVKGKLLPQDPNDEPTGELLKRIGLSSNDFTQGDRDGWNRVQLGLMVKLVSGQHIMNADYNENKAGIPYLTGPADFGERFPIITKWTERPKAVAVAGDVLVTVKGAGLGKLNIANLPEIAISRQLMAVRTMCMQEKYLFYLLRSYYKHFQASGVGIAIPGLSRTDILELIVEVPPLAEQRRIVEKVDRLMAFCDELDARQKERESLQIAFSGAALSRLTEAQEPKQFTVNLNRVKSHFDLIVHRPEDVKRVRETILQLAVMGKLVPQDPNDEPAGELLKRIGKEKEKLIAEGKIKETSIGHSLPSGWALRRLADLVDANAKISYGVLVPGPEVAKGVPFVRVQDLALKDHPPRPNKSIAAGVEKPYARTRLRGGEILLCVVGSIGKIGVAPPSWAGANIARAVARIAPNSELSRDYLLLVLQSPQIQSHFLAATRTLAQPTLNVGLIEGSPIPVPPYAEQRRIVEQVDRLLAICDELEAGLAKSREEGARLLEAVVAGVGK